MNPLTKSFLVCGAGVCFAVTAALAQVIIDNDDGAPGYVETGTWATSTSTGYDGGTYRFTSPGGTETATWTADLPATDSYEVFVWYRPGTNRVTSAKYDIFAADQTYTVYISQREGGFAWESLRTYTFNAGSNVIRLDAGGSSGGSAVIADAVRFGGDDDPIDPPVIVEVADGVLHATYTLPGPVVAHVLDFDLDDPRYTIEMGFAQKKRSYTSREPVSQVAARYDTAGHDVIGAINCAFFDFASIFMHGMLATRNNLVGLPTSGGPRETYMLQGSGEGWAVQDVPAASSVARFADGAELPLDVLDYTCGSSTLALYTPDWGPSTGSSAQGVEVIVQTVNYPLRANKWVSGRITAVRTGAASINNPIPPAGFVLAACPGAEASLLAHASVGDEVSVRFGLQPPDLNNARTLCGANGWLVKDGLPFSDGGWYPGFSIERHPRTVLAWSGTHHWFITFDGRQPDYSIGMTFSEMADFLIDVLHADNAVNLDGGGSTTMVVDGVVVNCPSDGADPPCTGTERFVPNALMLVKQDAGSLFPQSDGFDAGGRNLNWDDKFTSNAVVAGPPAPGGDEFVMLVMNPDGGYETASLGSAVDADYTVESWIYCDYRPDVATDGFERVGVYARDDGNANFDSAALGGGNCYALTFDSHDGRIRAGVVVEGAFTDYLEADPLYVPATAWRRFGLACMGTTVRYSIDGQTVAEVSDGTHPHGRFGVASHEYFNDDGLQRGCQADDFVAYALDFDWDNDGDIDLVDFQVFAFCFVGPDFTYSPGHVCLQMDGDGDSDVDFADFKIMQHIFTD